MWLRDIYARIVDDVTELAANVRNGGLCVNVQDQAMRALDLRFIQPTGVVSTLAVATAVGDMAVTVADATGFLDTNHIGIFNPDGTFYFGDMLGAPSGAILALDTPLDSVFPIGSNVVATTFNMAVDGSVTPQVFQIGPTGAPVDIDITRILGVMTDATAMDDGKFGGVDALTNGCVLRLANGTYQNIWNVKRNSDLQLLGYDFMYSAAAPAGVTGCRFRISYGGASKHGVVFRLGAGETLQFIIQDDLTGLLSFELMAQGHEMEA